MQLIRVSTLSKRQTTDTVSPCFTKQSRSNWMIVLILLVQVSFLPDFGTALPFLRKERYASSFLGRGHSHNDYLMDEPFDSAIQHGLKSIEVDVFPRNGGLLVAHTVFELDNSKRIDNMYIQPILSMLKRRKNSKTPTERRKAWLSDPDKLPPPSSALDTRGGTRRIRQQVQVSPGRPKLIGPETDSLTLLVDFKGDPEKSTSLLEQALTPLLPYLSRVTKSGEFRRGQVTVLISGNRPSDELLLRRHTAKHSGNRYLFLDGRMCDISSQSDTTLVPMVSIPWRILNLARSIGQGEAYMRHLANQAHQQGKLLRVWGAPNNEQVWRQMVRGNVDLLGIDDHTKFAQFAKRL
jgi:hypothetical protein